MIGCETLALHADTKRRIQGFEHGAIRNSSTEHKTNVRNMTAAALCPPSTLLVNYELLSASHNRHESWRISVLLSLFSLQRQYRLRK
ncbi:hypothetical protein DPMN_143461 [Dreissena polymorpha]|uniref:Uncharacterized protein n=1 Tax=Dreissena polymorpha TaxID=45954 RepID=A0A9D4GDQ7_DREPO|nr:hypothetical protein DPMN_143461 [Dreissena polymorpha]